MTAFWGDSHRTLYNGNCRNMSELADESVQMCCTSPPYWGLRKYAGEQESIWGGTPDCQHEWGTELKGDTREYGAGLDNWQHKTSDEIKPHIKVSQGQFCSLCGAWRGAYGLEPTVDMYVQHTVEILREIRRVLRPDGVCFWNVGDSYASQPAGNKIPCGFSQVGRPLDQINTQPKRFDSGIKQKDLCLIPFRVALAVQADGWWVRSDIIWNKPNPMPESVTDRPTDAYEHIFLFTKSAKYYWDAEAVKEESVDPESFTGRRPRNSGTMLKHDAENYGFSGSVQEDGTLRSGQTYPQRNLRNVWTFPTQPYREAHFATFPEELPERCIKAGSKEGDIVLDPFCGSGTTLEIAAKLNRKGVGYEISEEYCNLIIQRNRQGVLY